MRVHVWWGGVLGVVLAMLGAGGAEAQCRRCSAQMYCQMAASGALLCSGSGFACAMSIPCPMPFEDNPYSVAVVITLLDDPAPAAPLRGGGPSFKARGTGEFLDGSTAKRIVADAFVRRLDAELAAGRYISAGGPFSAAFRTRGGGGYSVRVQSAGSALRVTVRELIAGKPLRIVASETLEPDEVLVGRLRIEGRPYAMALQARTLRGSPAENAEVERRTQEMLYGELRSLPRRADLDATMTPLED